MGGQGCLIRPGRLRHIAQLPADRNLPREEVLNQKSAASRWPGRAVWTMLISSRKSWGKLFKRACLANSGMPPVPHFFRGKPCPGSSSALPSLPPTLPLTGPLKRKSIFQVPSVPSHKCCSWAEAMSKSFASARVPPRCIRSRPELDPAVLVAALRTREPYTASKGCKPTPCEERAG